MTKRSRVAAAVAIFRVRSRLSCRSSWSALSSMIYVVHESAVV